MLNHTKANKNSLVQGMVGKNTRNRELHELEANMAIILGNADIMCLQTEQNMFSL